MSLERCEVRAARGDLALMALDLLQGHQARPFRV